MKESVLYIFGNGAPAQALMQSVRPENVLSLRTLTTAKTGLAPVASLAPLLAERGFFLITAESESRGRGQEAGWKIQE